MRRVLVLVVCVVVAVGAFIVAQGSGNDSPSGSGSSAASSSSNTGSSSGSPEFTVTVRNHRPVGGKQKLTVHKDDHVRITVKSDSAVPAHLHGYEIEREVTPQKPGAFAFAAKEEGVFELELHTDPEVTIAQLTVAP